MIGYKCCLVGVFLLHLLTFGLCLTPEEPVLTWEQLAVNFSTCVNESRHDLALTYYLTSDDELVILPADNNTTILLDEPANSPLWDCLDALSEYNVGFVSSLETFKASIAGQGVTYKAVDGAIGQHKGALKPSEYDSPYDYSRNNNENYQNILQFDIDWFWHWVSAANVAMRAGDAKVSLLIN